MAFVKGLRPDGGGDIPEATKTGLAKALRKEATTILQLYTNAPPHTIANASESWDMKRNHNLEQKALLTSGSYGNTGHLIAM